ncbi:protein CLEC16A homolog [Oppia nitens]|uniref:protein CLEC16A homolog n=1 Tax=Oppia nitens TaxID=1686743 RepID=UPI0023DC7F50|nr:protein CLEC16A homolog [Oppia nitens]
MLKPKQWFGWSSKPKNPHSLEQLKYLFNVMSRSQTVTEQNRTLLVETLRSVAEILIWGDQNDSTVFDFFLEKNMLSFFLKIMKQKCGSYVCVQLLQTLNILFENIRNETSLYYLLSNNHVNSIIVHKFDFSDEEVMAYYISFLKTLSLKLNPHTIHFFFNEHTNDFPLYTEAIKFFNHSEKMVRIAVRTLTLNVFKVDEKSMLKFIKDCTAAPYFSNLVWFIGNNVINIDNCLVNDKLDGQQVLIRLDDLVAEHLDHLHYLNDILLLEISNLNSVLVDHMLNRLLIPLYIYSMMGNIPAATPSSSTSNRPHISQTVSLFLFTQVFLIVSNKSLLLKLVDILLNNDKKIFELPEFVAPNETLEESLIHAVKAQNSDENDSNSDENNERSTSNVSHNNAKHNRLFSNEQSVTIDANHQNNIAIENNDSPPLSPDRLDISITDMTSLTDEEKANLSVNRLLNKQNLTENRPFLEAILSSMDCEKITDDRLSLFSLCLLYAIINNSGISEDMFQEVILHDKSSKATTSQSTQSENLHNELINILIEIMRKCCQYNSKIRLITLEMSILLLKRLVLRKGKSILSDHHLAVLEQAKEEAILILRNFYKSEEEMLFLDMFEDEHQQLLKRQLNVEFLMMDSNLLLPPNQLTPLMMTGIEFNRRLPCADVERTRYAIQVFFLLRSLSQSLRDETETQLPLTNYDSCTKVDQLLDLNNSDLIACTVINKDQPKLRRFMVIDAHQLILIEPDTKRLGWGVAKFVAWLQDVEVNADKDDSRSLHIQIRQCSQTSAVRRAQLNAKFVFDDHIRCLAAKQRLTKGRLRARHRKMQQIARLIEISTIGTNDCTQSSRSSTSSNRDIPRSHSNHDGIKRQTHKPLCRGPAIPGSAVVADHQNKHLKPSLHRRRSASNTPPNGSQSRDSSPRPTLAEAEEMIPLEDMSPKSSRRRSRSKSENRLQNVLAFGDKCDRV